MAEHTPPSGARGLAGALAEYRVANARARELSVLYGTESQTWRQSVALTNVAAIRVADAAEEELPVWQVLEAAARTLTEHVPHDLYDAGGERYTLGDLRGALAALETARGGE